MHDDLIGPSPGTADDPAVVAARVVAEDLALQAQDIDADGVTRDQVMLLGHVGVLGVSAPQELGGAGAGPAVTREVTELLAWASGSLWFVAAQHRSPLEAAVTTTNAAVHRRWAEPLASGHALGAVAFAHLRRPGPPTLRAEPEEEGWRITGALDWITSWGLADVLLLMAETSDGRVVQAMISAEERDGFRPTEPLHLAAMTGARTVAASLTDVRVLAEEVAAVLPKREWSASDTQRTANVSPAVFGLLRAVVTELHRVGMTRQIPDAVTLAEAFASELRRLSSRAYQLVDDVPLSDAVDERVELRAQAVDLAQRAASALLTAYSGRGMSLQSPAQRWTREALFHLVQAQTAPFRTAILRRQLAALRSSANR